MPYRATTDVVRRVMPLIERLASRSIDQARLLQFLSAKAGTDWGVLDLVSDAQVPNAEDMHTRQLIFRDRYSGQESTLQYPDCLHAIPINIEDLIVGEYKRLAVDRPLTTMEPKLFAFLFKTMYCNHCRWQATEHAQVQRECHFAGHPINFEAGIGTR